MLSVTSDVRYKYSKKCDDTLLYTFNELIKMGCSKCYVINISNKKAIYKLVYEC